MGYVAGQIMQLGPTYASLVESPEAIHDWLECWDGTYHMESDLERLRAMNEEYMFQIMNYSDADLARIRRISNPSVIGRFANVGKHGAYLSSPGYSNPSDGTLKSQLSGHWKGESPGPRICIGDNHVIALVPPEASVGDFIVRFWDCSAALVMRPIDWDFSAQRVAYHASSIECGLLMVGRADIAKVIDAHVFQGRDRYAEDSLFYGGSARSHREAGGYSGDFGAYTWPAIGAVYVDLDFPTLQIITASIDAQGQTRGRDGYAGK